MENPTPSIENQIIILDRLTEFHLKWIQTHIELLSVVEWEDISLDNSNLTADFLIEKWFLEILEKSGGSLYIKITKEWMKYYEEIFSKKHNTNWWWLNSIKKWLFNFVKWSNTKKIIGASVAWFLLFFIGSNNEIGDKIGWNIFRANIWNTEVVLNEKDSLAFLRESFDEKFDIKCSHILSNEVSCTIEDIKIWEKNNGKESFLPELYEKEFIDELVMINEMILFRNKEWEIEIKN